MLLALLSSAGDHDVLPTHITPGLYTVLFWYRVTKADGSEEIRFNVRWTNARNLANSRATIHPSIHPSLESISARRQAPPPPSGIPISKLSYRMLAARARLRIYLHRWVSRYTYSVSRLSWKPRFFHTTVFVAIEEPAGIISASPPPKGRKTSPGGDRLLVYIHRPHVYGGEGGGQALEKTRYNCGDDDDAGGRREAEVCRGR